MISIQEFKTFVDEILKENGRLYKQSVLKNYKDNESVKYFLKQVYDPFIVFGISSKKLNKNVGVQAGNIWLDYPEDSEIFEYLKTHNTGTDKDIWTVQQFKTMHIAVDCFELFDKILTKTLVLGIDTKTINAVIPGLISEFNVMLANKYFEDPERINGHEFAITTKIDGGRIIAIKENGNVSFYTRQGQLYEGLVDLEDEMQKYMPDNICLDGEITLLNPGALTSKDQYKQTMKITRADGEKHGVKMLVFDFMTADEFRHQKCEMPYLKRRKYLESLKLDPVPYQCAGIDYSRLHYFKYFKTLPILYHGSDTKMISKILDEQVAKGEEGIMLNQLDAPYEFKRTWSLQKCKKMQTLDLEVIDYFEGKGTLANTLGGFIVRYKNGNAVRVGSGFDKDFRTEAWKHPADYIGKIIEVSYFEETVNQNGGTSLRFPIFKDFRTDKNIADF